eukprot:TRINITY_DN4643_c0_g1_i1.p1 TRINITY_DN4643_c0_g1~~TRINITY_DN4643_c0_g1_i1.p1  ORF type:complete len:382 (+),score=114.62 TRINITY_DN4643_c0_g1_i1:591-1736(+)
MRQFQADIPKTRNSMDRSSFTSDEDGFRSRTPEEVAAAKLSLKRNSLRQSQSSVDYSDIEEQWARRKESLERHKREEWKKLTSFESEDPVLTSLRNRRKGVDDALLSMPLPDLNEAQKVLASLNVSDERDTSLGDDDVIIHDVESDPEKLTPNSRRSSLSKEEFSIPKSPKRIEEETLDAPKKRLGIPSFGNTLEKPSVRDKARERLNEMHTCGLNSKVPCLGCMAEKSQSKRDLPINKVEERPRKPPSPIPQTTPRKETLGSLGLKSGLRALKKNVAGSLGVNAGRAFVNEAAPVPTTIQLLTSEKKIKDGTRLTYKGILGTVRFVGKTSLGEGDWIGLEMDERVGTHDGEVKGVRYFEADEGHGIMVNSSSSLLGLPKK